MGVYIYSLRAKTVSLLVSGTKVSAHLYSYAYRQSSIWRGDYGYNSYQLTAANTERNATNVFNGRAAVPYVIVGDMKDGLDGSSVYVDVTAPVWYDCEKFPGVHIGWLQKAGKSYTLADRTKWSEGTKALRDDVWVPIRTRSIMIDGKATYQSVDIGDEADIEREVAELRPGA